jgi:ribosome-associated protein
MNEIHSKSQQKREAQALQAFGLVLVELKLSQLDTLPLSTVLRKAIEDAKRLKSHAAVRRQALWIGKLLRRENADALLLAYEAMQAQENNQTAAFHALEIWRTRLTNGEAEALTELIQTYPAVESQKIRSLIKKAQEEQLRADTKVAQRALFRYLRSVIA